MSAGNSPVPEATYRVLILDDDPAQAEMMAEYLRLVGYRHVAVASDVPDAWQALKRHTFDIVLLDYKLHHESGLEVLQEVTKRLPSLAVVMVTGQGNEQVAVEAIRRGAADYVLKSGHYLTALPTVIHKAVQAQRLQAARERAQEQIRYQALLLGNVREAIVVWDVAGRITFWNPAATALFGYTPQERLGRPVESAYLALFDPPLLPPKSEETTLGQHLVRRYRHPQGQTLWVSVRLSALRYPNQPESLLGFIAVGYDITARMRAEQALRESEARYRAIVDDYQTELICRMKPNGVLTFVNEVFCRYFGQERRALLGMNFLYLVPERQRPKVLRYLSAFSSAHPTGRLEHGVLTPTQGLRWIQRSDRAILDPEGKVTEIQCMGRDITEHKHLEEQVALAQAQLLQAARLATLGELAADLAHQIYNPLSTIIAEAQLLQRAFSLDQQQRESTQAIEQAGWRVQQAVQRLLEFWRAGGHEESLAVNQTLENALALVSHSLAEAGCTLEVSLAADLPPIRGQRSQLESLWVNLLLLTRQALSQGTYDGRPPLIQVTTRWEPPATNIVLIQENGTPLPETQVGTIIEPHYLENAARSTLGLELNLCAEIVRQQRGELSVLSGPERATIFRVALPAEV